MTFVRVRSILNCDVLKVVIRPLDVILGFSEGTCASIKKYEGDCLLDIRFHMFYADLTRFVT